MNRVQVWLAGPEAAAAVDHHRLDPADRARAARLVGSRKEGEWLASRALWQQAAPGPGAATSLSHAAGHAAVAVGPAGHRLGVDVEGARPRDVLRLARFAFAPEEAEQLEALDAGEALERFYLLWTLKEACAKALGLSLLTAQRECRFVHDAERWHGNLPGGGGWSAAAWKPRPGLVLSAIAFDPMADSTRWRCREWPDVPGDWPLLAAIAASPAIA